MVAAVALLCACSTEAAELRRDAGWTGGLGFGPSRGALYPSGADADIWATGSSPQIRVGKMLGDSFSLGLEFQTWFIEVGTAGDWYTQVDGEDLPIQLKLRLTGHVWGIAGTWYPASQGFWSGVFARVGTGPAIANFALAIADPADPTGAREIQARIDEWGWGAIFVLGYEVPVSRSLAAGVQFNNNYLWIDEDIDWIWFGGPSLHLTWYF